MPCPSVNTDTSNKRPAQSHLSEAHRRLLSFPLFYLIWARYSQFWATPNSSWMFDTLVLVHHQCGKMCVNRSWKIPQSDHFYINQENGFCQDFVDCNGFFGLRGRLQVNKSVTILIQSRQSCCNSVQSSIVKFLHNPVQSIQSKHNWGTHRGIVPKTGISWQTTWGSNPITIAKAKMTFQNGSMQGSDQPKSWSLHFHNLPQLSKIFFEILHNCIAIARLCEDCSILDQTCIPYRKCA